MLQQTIGFLVQQIIVKCLWILQGCICAEKPVAGGQGANIKKIMKEEGFWSSSRKNDQGIVDAFF